MFNWFRKPADTDMQQIQPADPAQPTVKEMDDIAAAFKSSRDFWKGRAVKAEAELARLKASRERSNANLAAANAKRRAEALAKAPAVRLTPATPPAGDRAIPAA